MFYVNLAMETQLLMESPSRKESTSSHYVTQPEKGDLRFHLSEMILLQEIWRRLKKPRCDVVARWDKCE